MGNYICQCSDATQAKELQNAKAKRPVSPPQTSSSSSTIATFDSDDCQKSFRKLAVLGRGAYSTVFLVEYRGRHQKQGDRYALKQISKKKLRNQRLVNEILTERDILASFKNPFMISLRRSFQDKQNCYFVTEWAKGGDVHSFIYNQKDPHKVDMFRQTGEDGPRFIVACVIQALQALHDGGIMYRDLKPQNVMVDGNGYAKLGDFGLAVKITKEGQSQVFAGTVGYQAPEIIQKKNYGRQVDLWSLGVLLYELIFKDLPFDAYQVAPHRYRSNFKAFESGSSWPENNRASNHARDLISSLMRLQPSERLGAKGWQDIKSHPFFKGMDWEKLNKEQMESPLKRILEREPEIEPDLLDQVETAEGTDSISREIQRFSYQMQENAVN